MARLKSLIFTYIPPPKLVARYGRTKSTSPRNFGRPMMTLTVLLLLGTVRAIKEETCDPFESFTLHPVTKGATHDPRPSQHQVT